MSLQVFEDYTDPDKDEFECDYVHLSPEERVSVYFLFLLKIYISKTKTLNKYLIVCHQVDDKRFEDFFVFF